MADIELKSDQEKAEELKAWWRTNGLSVFAGITLTVGGMFGWNYWKDQKLTRSEGASRLFAQMTKEGTDSASLLKQLNSEYGDTAYASLAELTLAKSNCEAGKTDECIEQLRNASNSTQNSIALLAKVRLARTLISSGKLDEAQTILAEKMPTAFQSLISELNGDIHFAKKEYGKAREAYDRAILSANGQDILILQMKRDDLGDHLKNGA